ncbi:AAA family ATPase [Paraburkholderia sediminicola]|uniref:AAA family ATPase n=1 Tax=Paraburkholderia sediminicola TaxID=458836 RepID=UPI0038BC6CBD
MNYEDLKKLVPEPGHVPAPGLLLEAFPQLARLAQTPQDALYHAEGDVWTHTLMVLAALVAQPDYACGTEEERFILFIAALLHDISKPDTTVIDPVTGKIGQPGHSRRGAVDARILLWRAEVPFGIRETICRIISVHQLPFFALTSNKEGRSPEYVVRKLSHELPLWMLCCVARADMEGRTYAGKDDCLVDIELFRQFCAEEGCLYSPRKFEDDYTRVAYFRGADVHPDYSLFAEPGSQVTVMTGLPASGKDTWVARHCKGLPVVSYDDAREELGLRHGKNEGQVGHFARDKAKALLREKAPFVWNATHLSRQMRENTVDLLFAYNARVRIIYLETTERTLYARNSHRNTSLRNSDIERMLFRWEVPLPTEAHEVEYVPDAGR